MKVAEITSRENQALAEGGASGHVLEIACWERGNKAKMGSWLFTPKYVSDRAKMYMQGRQ